MKRLLPFLAFTAIGLFFMSYVKAQDPPLSFSTQGQSIVINIPADFSSGILFDGNLEIYMDQNTSTYVVYMNKAELIDAIPSSGKLTHAANSVHITFDFSDIIKRIIGTYQFVVYFEDGTNGGIITFKKSKIKVVLYQENGKVKYY